MSEPIPAAAWSALSARAFPLVADLEIVGQECTALLVAGNFAITQELLQLLAKAASSNVANYWRVRGNHCRSAVGCDQFPRKRARRPSGHDETTGPRNGAELTSK